MKNNNWVIYDGNLIRANQPVVPVESRGLMYGDGCFETLRLYGASYFKLNAHLNRLRAGAEFLGLDYPAELEPSCLKPLITKLLEQNKLQQKDTVIRIQLWRAGRRGYHVQGIKKPHHSILATPLPGLPASVALATVDIKRIPNQALPSKFKLCNTINYITAANQARQKGADDALMQTVDGFLSETTIANLFWISGNTICTPSVNCDLLPGITRKVLIGLIKKNKEVEIEEGTFRLKDILNADAVWICNSVRGLLAVSEIDGRQFNIQHSFLDELKLAFTTYVKRELQE